MDHQVVWTFKHALTEKKVPFTLTCSPGSRAQQLGPRHVGWHALLSPQVLPHSSPHVTVHLEGCRGSTFSMWTLILWPSSFRQTTVAPDVVNESQSSSSGPWLHLNELSEGKKRKLSAASWGESGHSYQYVAAVCESWLGAKVCQPHWSVGLVTQARSTQSLAGSGRNQQTQCQGQETVLWDLLCRKDSEWNGWVCDRFVVVRISTIMHRAAKQKYNLQSDKKCYDC